MKKKKVIDFAEYKKLALLFQEAVSHLEFCGYGDEYERECARDEKLPQRLEHMDIRTRQILQMNGGSNQKFDLDDGLDESVIGSLP